MALPSRAQIRFSSQRGDYKIAGVFPCPSSLLKMHKGIRFSKPRQGRGDSATLRGITRHWSFQGSGEGQGLPLPSRIESPFTEFRFLPADASGAYRPDPQANNQTCSSHPSRNGIGKGVFPLDFPFWPSYISCYLQSGLILCASGRKGGKP